jgi:hypothetical protein
MTPAKAQRREVRKIMFLSIAGDIPNVSDNLLVMF